MSMPPIGKSQIGIAILVLAALNTESFAQQAPVPIEAPPVGRSYKMTNSDGKDYDFKINFITDDKNRLGPNKVGSFHIVYFRNPNLRKAHVCSFIGQYGVLESFYFSWLEFYPNPYGPGYHWHRINSNFRVIERGELRLK